MSKTLVFGASLNPNRYSYLVIKKLIEKNITTEAFGKNLGTILHLQIKDNLTEFQNINTVTLYLNPSKQVEYYNAIVKLQPKRVIFNPGTENPEFYKLLKKNNIDCVIGCTLVMLATNQY